MSSNSTESTFYKYFFSLRISTRITVFSVILFSLVLIIVVGVVNALTQRFLVNANYSLITQKKESIKNFYMDAQSYYENMLPSQRLSLLYLELSDYQLIQDERTDVFLLDSTGKAMLLKGVSAVSELYKSEVMYFFDEVTGKEYAEVMVFNEALDTNLKRRLQLPSKGEKMGIKTSKFMHTMYYSVERFDTLDGTSIFVVIARSSKEDTNFIFVLNIAILVSIAIGMIFVAIMSYLLSKQSLKPLVNLAHEAKRLNIDELNYRIPVPESDDEVAELTKSLNAMFSDLGVSVEAQKRFTSDASHELRIPLTVIIGYVDLIRNVGYDDHSLVKESLDEIYNEALNMKHLINRLLTIARLQNNKIVVNNTEISLSAFLINVYEESTLLYPDRRFELYEDVKTNEYTVLADIELLTQVIRGIIENAVKYSFDGTLIKLYIEEKPTHYCINIHDFGKGIPQSDIARLKDRFFRVDSARNRETGGTGLGLAIADGLMNALGGRLNIESELGQYTKVTMCVPKAGFTV